MNTYEYRYERKKAMSAADQWSAWDTSEESTKAMAANPDFGTGLVQRRIAPNRIAVRVVDVDPMQEHGRQSWQ